MKPYTKMMLMTYGKKSGEERRDRPGEYPREEGGYDIESRRPQKILCNRRKVTV